MQIPSTTTPNVSIGRHPSVFPRLEPAGELASLPSHATDGV